MGAPAASADLDRGIGALLGLACGDAVGTALEFKRPGTFEPIDDMVGGGPFGLQAGQWTDDTSMALCLAESILDTGGLDPVDQLRRYVLWQTEGYLSSNGRCFDIGGTTANQLLRFRTTGEPFDPEPDQESAANGSLMRLAPVPIRWHADPATAAELSAASSRTTHPARRPSDACRVLGAMTSALVGGQAAAEVLAPDFWRFGELAPAVADVAAGSWLGKEPPAIRGSGYCVDAMEAALWAVGGASSFPDAILRAANLGDDADTTAAIAGQLAGARWGTAGIPAGWRQRLARAERIASLGQRLHLAGSGAAEPEWGFDPYLHAWWVEPGKLLAGEYPGSLDPQRAAEQVDLLVDAGIRTFVDLTMPDDRLEPYDRHLAEASARRQLDLRRLPFPIPDFSVTTDDGYRRIVQTIAAGQSRGGVYVHCWGGVGRVGTVIGCWLADSGLSHPAVLDRIAELRSATRKAARRCPETDQQREVVWRWTG